MSMDPGVWRKGVELNEGICLLEGKLGKLKELGRGLGKLGEQHATGVGELTS
jgi:hypothetical protein